jgi:hypothetical protein
MPLQDEEMETRFTYHAPKGDQTKKYEIIREMAKTFATLLSNICPDCRETSLAFTKIEEAVMWANAAIARRK